MSPFFPARCTTAGPCRPFSRRAARPPVHVALFPGALHDRRSMPPSFPARSTTADACRGFSRRVVRTVPRASRTLPRAVRTRPRAVRTRPRAARTAPRTVRPPVRAYPPPRVLPADGDRSTRRRPALAHFSLPRRRTGPIPCGPWGRWEGRCSGSRSTPRRHQDGTASRSPWRAPARGRPRPRPSTSRSPPRTAKTCAGTWRTTSSSHSIPRPRSPPPSPSSRPTSPSSAPGGQVQDQAPQEGRQRHPPQGPRPRRHARPRRRRGDEPSATPEVSIVQVRAHVSGLSSQVGGGRRSAP